MNALALDYSYWCAWTEETMQGIITGFFVNGAKHYRTSNKDLD